MSKLQYKIELPLFTDEATSIWKDMPSVIRGLVAKKQDAIDKFNRLDTIVNGGQLKVIGKAFGQDIYARFSTDDIDDADYMAKRLASMIASIYSSKPEVITIGDKTYTVVLKEDDDDRPTL